MKTTATDKNKKKNRRDGSNESLWESHSPEQGPSVTPAHIGDVIFDSVIIGGGLTGVTAAYLLQKAGKQCVLAEAHNIGFGTTGGTSAHINTFADTSYKEAEDAFGKEGAKLFANAINDGFDLIRNIIKSHRIHCDFEEMKGFLYAEDEKQADQLKDVYDGCRAVGVEALYSENVPTPIRYMKALVFEGQAQFHPLKYLAAVHKAYSKLGGVTLEHAKVTTIGNEDNVHHVHAGGIIIKAKHVIYATHIPPGVNVFSFRCAPYRSYVLGVTLKGDNYPDALIYDMQEPYHYFRSHDVDGQKYLIAGGNDHKTGHEDPEKAFQSLEKYVRKHYDVADVKYKWSSQYYVPVDGLPYIGSMPGKEKIYCATGYNGNGMMLGTVAAQLLCDLVSEKKNKYEALFSPARIKPIAGFKEFVSENADVAYQFIASRFNTHKVDFLKRLKKDSGKVVEFEGEKVAVYRDSKGELHALSPLCTHAKCIVNWNEEEKSWDCPCHGARYDINGVVLNGPAQENLKRIEL